ncbi:MAG: ArsB/NhaD family transporter [Pseudomonadota bacterium]
MKRFRVTCCLSFFFVFAALSLSSISVGFFPSESLADEVVVSDYDLLDIYGKIVNSHGSGVAGARVEVSVNGHPVEVERHGNGHGEEGFKTEPDGTFQGRVKIPLGEMEGASVDITAYKTSYTRENLVISHDGIAKTNNGYVARADLAIKRTTSPAFWIAAIVFVLAYILISFELLHRTLAAMLGASIMLVVSYTLGTINPEYHILSYESAIGAIDMNVIFLLMGMMIIIGILKHTGIFQWCAYKSYQLARGNVIVLAMVLMLFTAVTSAFLDNVTTMLLLTPVSIEIALSLGISPLALLIPEILASNIGGTATLIGDPPNIMIGSYAGLTFMDFVVNLAPVCVVSMAFLFVYARLAYGREYGKAKIDDVPRFLAQLREEYRITDATLLVVGLLVMGIVVGLFLSHGYWHMEVSIAALFGASLLFTYGLVTKKIDLLELIEKDIEWTTLLFFMFLFMLVGGVEETGLLDIIADGVLRLSGGDLTKSICLILWVAAIMSAFVDNIPFTATMLPIVAYLTEVIPGAQSNVLWWALAFGACFGGNGTMIGASANVVTLGIAESAGHPIKFVAYMKVCFLYMLISVALANVWLLLFY